MKRKGRIITIAYNRNEQLHADVFLCLDAKKSKSVEGGMRAIEQGG